LRPLEGVRELRERRMLSQQELAYRAGVSLFTIQRIERGQGSVRPKTGRAIAAALGVGVEDLLPKAQAPLPDFDVQERRTEARVVESCIGYVVGRAKYYEEELERGRTGEYKTAAGAVTLACLAADELSALSQWLYNGPGWNLLVATDEDPYELDAKVSTMIDHMRRAVHALFDHADHLAKTEEQRDALAAKREEAAEANASAERRIA
jgi:transcriptional regulator with XRE-family HTH domain